MGAAKLSAFNQERWVGDLRVPKIIERIRSHYFPPIKSSKASLARGDDVKTYTLTEAISRINKAQNGGSPVRIVAKLILEGEHTNGIRGSLLLPRDPNPELTSSLDIAVFCPPHLWQIATSAGASRVGDSSNLLPLILDPINGIIPDRVVATNDQMGTMARLARILGPLGLMPTIRSGTLVPPAEAQIKEAIEYARKSSPFRVEREMATFSMLVSRCGWSVPLIRENVTTVMNWLQNQRKTTESNRFIENASFVIENMSESARNDSVTEEILPIAEIEYAGSKGPRFKEALVRLREEVAKRRASYVST